VTVRCPNCATELRVAAGFTESKAKCGACGAVVTMPSAAEPARQCPSCGGYLAQGMVVCLNCGLNLDTGKRVATTTERAEDAEEPPAPPTRAFLFVANLMPGLFRIKVLLLAVVMALAAFGVLGLGLFFMMLGVWLSAFAIAAGGVVIYGQAVAWLLDGELTLLSNALADFDGPKWWIFFGLLSVPLVVLFLLLRALMGAA